MNTTWIKIIIGIGFVLAIAQLLTIIFSVQKVISVEIPVEAAHAETVKPLYVGWNTHLSTWHKIDRLIDCESDGRNVKIIDTNGYYSYGILQYQSSTWNWWVKESGFSGSPMVRADAIRMAHWAIEHGYLSHWSCAKIEGLL